jgi:hypothetical protein
LIAKSGPQNAFRLETWNEIEILLASDIVRSYLNDSSFSQKGALSAATDDSGNDFGQSLSMLARTPM